MSESQIEGDVTKAATAAVEAAPAVEAGVQQVTTDLQADHPLAAASDAAAAISSTLSTVASSGTIGNNDVTHVTWASELAGLLSKFLAILAKL